MPAASFLDFVLLGFRHIFSGYDHLFFLTGLLLVVARWPQLIAIVTCFTAGHSLTLALATLGIVNPPGRLTEPLIALTIVFVGVENYLRKGEPPKGRWLVTLLFGMVHGFGFASVLRELGVGTDGRSIAAPLLGFNIGVELGQLVFAAGVLPLCWWLRKRPDFTRVWAPALSLIIAALGACWFIQRVTMV